MKKRINISVSPDTELLLKTYAKEHHTTVSQAITDWIWSEKEELLKERREMVQRICDKCGKQVKDAENAPVKRYYISRMVANENDTVFDLCDACYQKVISYIFEQERKEVTNNESGES